MEIKNLTMSYGLQILYEDASIHIPENEKVAIVGVNGAGKTTLFKIIMGLIEPDKGKIVFKEKTRISLLPQLISDEIPCLDISVFDFLLEGRPIKKLENDLQNIYERLAISSLKEQNELYKKIDKIQKQLDYWECYSAENTLLQIIDGMNISSSLLDKKINTLSGGQKSKIAFARLLYSKPELILLDEPTNHLDKESKDYVINYLKNYQGSVFIISHDVDFLNQVTNKTLYLNKISKSFELYNANYDGFLKRKSEKERLLDLQIRKQEQEEKKLKDIIGLYTNSSGKRKKMSQDREKKLAKLLENKIETPSKDKYAKLEMKMDRRSSQIPIKVDNLYFKYNKSSNDYVINNLSFSLINKEKFLIVGPNGVGKSTLLKLIMGFLKQDKGSIFIDNKTDIGYYAQEHELLENNRTVIENFEEFELTENQLRNVLGRFLFTNENVFKKINVLSPGERSRVALAKLSLKNANFLILDEPTNHLDPETQEIITETFKTFLGTMLIVSHNPDFIDNLGINRILTLPSGKITYYDRKIVEYYWKINNKKQ